MQINYKMATQLAYIAKILRARTNELCTRQHSRRILLNFWSFGFNHFIYFFLLWRSHFFYILHQLISSQPLFSLQSRYAMGCINTCIESFSASRWSRSCILVIQWSGWHQFFITFNSSDSNLFYCNIGTRVEGENINHSFFLCFWQKR